MRWLGLILLMATIARAEPPSTRPALPTTRPDQLAEVQNLDELRQQPLFDIPGVGKLRLGIAPYDSELGPWRVVFALQEGDASEAEEYGELDPPDGEPHELGPLEVYACGESSHRVKALQAVQCGCRMAFAGQELHQVVVPLTETGNVHIKVMTPAGHFVAETIMKVDVVEPSPWQPFAMTKWRDDSDDPDIVVSGEAYSVVPTLETSTDCATDSNMSLLPVDPQLKLALKDGVFTVGGGKRELLEDPAQTLLARWWLNGHAVPAPCTDPTSAANDQANSTASKVEVKFGLPGNLGDAKVGDKVMLQVLYCSGGFEAVSDKADSQDLEAVQDASEKDAMDLAISNKLEFVVTEAMLKK